MSDQRPVTPLDRLAVGAEGTVQLVGSAHARDLLREGILPGTTLRVRSRAPLRGPVIVELLGGAGTTTIALSRGVASAVGVSRADRTLA